MLHVSSRIESCFGQYLGPNGKIYSAFDVHTHKTIIVKGWSKNHKWNGKMIFFCLFYWIYLCYRMHICVSQFKGWKKHTDKKEEKSVSWYECYYYYFDTFMHISEMCVRRKVLWVLSGMDVQFLLCVQWGEKYTLQGLFSFYFIVMGTG